MPPKRGKVTGSYGAGPYTAATEPVPFHWDSADGVDTGIEKEVIES